MQCGSCFEEIPDDSIFCPECGSRQDMSRAGGLPGVGGVGLGGQDVSGSRNFGVVSGEAVMNQNLQNLDGQGMPQGMMPDIMSQIAPNLGGMPQGNAGLPPINQGMPLPNQTVPQSNVTPLQNQNPQTITGSDIPPTSRGPSLSGGIGPNSQIGNMAGQVGGTAVSQNPSLSPTDAMVNRIAEAERAVKNERRSQWLQMNQQSAANVLSSIGGELPSHLKTQDETSTAEFLANAIGSGRDDSGNDALFKRMSEVAVRRVARKRGVAVDTPQTKSEDGILTVNVTYIDDGRVLDTPEDLSAAFEHAISTEVALKGLDVVVEINLFRSKDGSISKIGDETVHTSDDDEEMFACEVCDGLVKESDKDCPHCGAVFEEEEPEISQPARGSPPGPSRGGPPGPSRGGPPGPSRRSPPTGGPPKRSGPPGGGPPGPRRSGPPSGGPSGGGPPKKSGPPSGGPPGPKRSGPPSGGPSGGGPPKRSGPPGGGPLGQKRGPPSGSPSGGGPPKRSGPPSGGPPGPKRGGPPGPKRGPPK